MVIRTPIETVFLCTYTKNNLDTKNILGGCPLSPPKPWEMAPVGSMPSDSGPVDLEPAISRVRTQKKKHSEGMRLGCKLPVIPLHFLRGLEVAAANEALERDSMGDARNVFLCSTAQTIPRASGP